MVVKNLKSLNPKTILSLKDYGILLNTLLLIVGSGFVLYFFQDQFEDFGALKFNSTFGSILFYFTMLILAFKLYFFAFLLFHYLKYKPIESVKDDELPTITLLVPAYNEGAFVYDTLQSIAKSNYPKEKIQLIAIDDGSVDDTWEWMKKAKAELGDFLTIIQQPENKGKRHALYRGFNLGTGDVFVTIDSDSLIYVNTLRNLVSPFVVDKKCGAVAGNVKIQNANDAIIPKMLNVSFAFSFGFIRAAQGQMKSVLCTPGALSAYRKEAVMGCLEEWIDQTFMGVKTDIGEDRAMTNMIMKQGYNTLFQSNALVATNIPETYSVLRKMFTRWERSNVRENIMMSKFAFSDFRTNNKLNPRILLVNQWLTIITAYPTLILMFLSLIFYPVLFLSTTIISIALFSLIPAIYYAVKSSKRNALWIFSYNIFYFFTLFWITPYAIVTASRRGWLTRSPVVQ
ncbi:glycosyltransferase [Brumimicrobium mesophilum]|uniref:glycosyltransferase n=1 Tax=Brumimicrobium mesophilum TaxID=392717 RepID=UPI000D141248|nr:glycosyltransferase [Brumimicrobium mesophilum]